MLAASSISGSLSKLAQSKRSNSQQREDEISGNEYASVSSSSSSWRPSREDEDEASVYHDVTSNFEDDSNMNEDQESCGGTILASLSSRDVLRNIKDSMAGGRLSAQPSGPRRLHLTELNQRSLQEIATVHSDALSFTPTMAEMALSSHGVGLHQGVTQQNSSERDTIYSSFQDHGARYESSSMLGVGIREVQPQRVACPFCDREKDLEWRLTKEREESQELKLSGYRARFVLVALIVILIVAIVSFIAGKVLSDFHNERTLNQYMAQCNAMMSQNQEEEMYWKLVTAAFSALINAAAGPAANFVFNGGK